MGRRGWGGKDCGSSGAVLQLQWGDGGEPSKGQLGPDPDLGALEQMRENECKRKGAKSAKERFCVTIANAQL